MYRRRKQTALKEALEKIIAISDLLNYNCNPFSRKVFKHHKKDIILTLNNLTCKTRSMRKVTKI